MPLQLARNPRNFYLWNTGFVRRFNGGLNLKSSPNLLRDDQAQVADNVEFDSLEGAVISREGYGIPAGLSAVFPGTADPIGLHQAEFVDGSGNPFREVLAVDGGATASIYSNDGTGWTDRTGALARAGAVFRARFAQMKNLVIGVDRDHAPFKWDGLAASASLLGGSPPTGDLVIVWNNYLFIARDKTKPNRLYYSDLGDPETWPANNFIDVPSPFDGDPIMGLGIAYGQLIILKRNSLYALSGAVAADFTLSQVTAQIGLAAVQCLAHVEDTLWFLGDRGPYQITPDLNIQHMGHWVEPIYRNAIALVETNGAFAHYDAHYNRNKNQVWFSLRTLQASTAADRVIVHDIHSRDEFGQAAVSIYKFDKTPVLFADLKPGFSTPPLSHDVLLMSGGADDRIYQHDSGLTDNGVAYVSEWRSPLYGLGDDMALKALRYLRTTAGNVAGSWELRVGKTDQPGLAETLVSFAAAFGTQQVVPNAAGAPPSKFWSMGFRSTSSGASLKFTGWQYEFAYIGRRN